MKIVVFTSNALRHKFIANTLASHADEALVISEVKPHDAPALPKDTAPTPIQKHFALRYETEKVFFAGNDILRAPSLPIMHREVNLQYVYDAVERFQPDMAFVFGAWIIRKPLLSLIPAGKFINLHLGVSPYYRGAGTNFWPFVNDELEYVGSTILHIDDGIDTGDIIAHVRPTFEKEDTVHTAGCKVIRDSAACLVRIMKMAQDGNTLPRVQQWKSDVERYYKESDFTEERLQQYYTNLEHGMIEKYINNPKSKIQLVTV